MSIVRNKAQFLKALDREEERVTRLFRQRVRKTVSEALRRLIAKTPVHTGATVASYVTGTGAGGGFVHPGFGSVEPTNHLPLGAEQNRPKAEAVARAKLDALSFDNPFQLFQITNAAPQAALLEAGLAPTPDTTRAPAGMFRVTNEEIILLLQRGKL
ncbi:hypothetical protein PXK30_09405 [Phaeobacter gallaeciensis]|uniref:hypothetical protein n=1 Tax=Phaeobacter gallaeciensis TaxID=60890 RepID=UPI00237FD40A|nr:hypothetical protein [Phaeobacter gallaeciensis]MDE4303662.1 hypothetical protein [Phaeobacter gallaeciensis]MDE4307857.1 hypothetical protein [Phaeobacter gallaeciensis]MDE4312315.1 hypothetical protein [Phaeobacter gallaeciensis]MDE4316786.1 hypothetical protein [Phaeobacter gallaeciensis]MDE4321249.1 hypothetical protein [Phaeobacter gallaeciensis]